MSEKTKEVVDKLNEYYLTDDMIEKGILFNLNYYGFAECIYFNDSYCLWDSENDEREYDDEDNHKLTILEHCKIQYESLVEILFKSIK